MPKTEVNNLFQIQLRFWMKNENSLLWLKICFSNFFSECFRKSIVLDAFLIKISGYRTASLNRHLYNHAIWSGFFYIRRSSEITTKIYFCFCHKNKRIHNQHLKLLEISLPFGYQTKDSHMDN